MPRLMEYVFIDMDKIHSMKILLDQIMYSKNLSVRQVSILTDIPKSTIQKIKLEQKSPTMDEMEAIAKGLKLRINDLFLSDFQ